jgi:hypothetical protein
MPDDCGCCDSPAMRDICTCLGHEHPVQTEVGPHEHEESLKNTGFGFGHLDYYCTHCEVRTRSVALADLNVDERRRVGGHAVWAMQA